MPFHRRPGESVTFSGSATDPSTADTAAGFQYRWDFGDGQTSNQGLTTHVYNTAGVYNITLTVTDKDGGSGQAAATISITTGGGTAINIDPNWIQQHGPGPYLLDQNGATYLLQTDVTTCGTAFVISGRNVTFDLNGHTVTYDDAWPIAVPNGDFEADPIGSTTITSWDISGAPNSTFTITANDVYLYGSKVLKWSVPAGVSAPQVIKSAAITIPQAKRVYTASISTSPLKLTFNGCTLMMEVVDSITGQTMANFNELDSNDLAR